jgi:transposase
MSDTFVYEFILKTNPHERKILDIRLEMARFLYNAILNEGFKKIALIRQSKIFQKAKKTRSFKDYNEVDKLYKFSDYDLQHFAIKTKNNSMIKDHIDTHVCQKIATRVYVALDKYRKGKKGRPRFKSKNQLMSIEGKSNITGIRFKKKQLHYKGLILDPVFNKNDEVQEYAVQCPIKYCRIIKREIKNKIVWCLQLILKGKSFVKEKNISQNNIVGIDIGPSTIAVFQDKHSFLTSFCSKLKPLHLRLKNLQRKMDRSLRSTNPDNYNEKKQVKKKVLTWLKSKNYKKNQTILYEVYRKLKTHRKRLHGRLSNKIIRLGNIIRTEDLSFKAFQKMYGRSIGFRAPSLFLNILGYKAENAGGRIEKINTRKTYLSQICHNCLKKEKKPLSIRWHKCSCGIKPVQRDLYSAFLARYVENNKLDIRKCRQGFPGAHLLLEQAILELNQTAIGKRKLSSFGLSQSQSSLLVKDRSIVNDVKDDVGIFSESL